MAIYQARFMRYLDDRGLLATEGRKVWAFVGDGETDEPESLGAISLAARERLDNLIFVVNCNLQRLDGPVRANGKSIQELEVVFRGAGWNVIKVIWGAYRDPLIARDTSGLHRAQARGSRLRAVERFAPGLGPKDRRISYVESCLASREGPVVAATDYMRSYAHQIRAFVPRRYVVLGTDGFGRSDTRERRRFFEVDRDYITLAALTVLAEEDTVPRGLVSEALEKYGIDPERPDPSVSLFYGFFVLLIRIVKVSERC